MSEPPNTIQQLQTLLREEQAENAFWKERARTLSFSVTALSEQVAALQQVLALQQPDETRQPSDADACTGAPVEGFMLIETPET